MISYKQFSEIKIPFPSLPEQQKIAACLSSLDDLINAQRQKIELLQQHKKGLLQGLFPAVSDTETVVETLHATSLPTHNTTTKPNPNHG